MVYMTPRYFLHELMHHEEEELHWSKGPFQTWQIEADSGLYACDWVFADLALFVDTASPTKLLVPFDYHLISISLRTAVFALPAYKTYLRGPPMV
jgi:hypothetical protein